MEISLLTDQLHGSYRNRGTRSIVLSMQSIISLRVWERLFVFLWISLTAGFADVLRQKPLSVGAFLCRWYSIRRINQNWLKGGAGEDHLRSGRPKKTKSKEKRKIISVEILTSFRTYLVLVRVYLPELFYRS